MAARRVPVRAYRRSTGPVRAHTRGVSGVAAAGVALVGIAWAAGSTGSVSTSASAGAQVRPAAVRAKQTKVRVGSIDLGLATPQAEVRLTSGRRSRIRFRLRVSNPTDRSVVIRRGLQQLRSVHGCVYPAAPATVEVSAHRTTTVSVTFVIPSGDPPAALVLRVGKRSRSVALQVGTSASPTPSQTGGWHCAAGSTSAGRDDPD